MDHDAARPGARAVREAGGDEKRGFHRCTGGTDVVFLPVIVTRYPEDDDHAPLLADSVAARLAQAGEVDEGDTILASVCHPDDRLGRTDYFNAHYEAHPRPFDPACGCGVCELADPTDGPHVVLTDSCASGPWETCDPWPAAAIVLIVPALRLA